MADIIVYEKDEEQLYQEVRDILVNARDRAYNNANKIMTYDRPDDKFLIYAPFR